MDHIIKIIDVVYAQLTRVTHSSDLNMLSTNVADSQSHTNNDGKYGFVYRATVKRQQKTKTPFVSTVDLFIFMMN